MGLNVIIKVLKYIHPVESVMVVIFVLMSLVAVVLIVKDVIKEVLHPSKTTEIADEDLDNMDID